jgi:hypothetical protein
MAAPHIDPLLNARVKAARAESHWLIIEGHYLALLQWHHGNGLPTSPSPLTNCHALPACRHLTGTMASVCYTHRRDTSGVSHALL